MSETFEPKIVAFVCNWCAYAGADLAGVARMQYPTNVRLIRLMCTGQRSIMPFCSTPIGRERTASWCPGDTSVTAITWEVMKSVRRWLRIPWKILKAARSR